MELRDTSTLLNILSSGPPKTVESSAESCVQKLRGFVGQFDYAWDYAKINCLGRWNVFFLLLVVFTAFGWRSCL